MKLRILAITGLILIASLISTPLWAQPSDPPGGDGGGDPVGDGAEDEVPLGIEWLVAGGVAYGVTKFRKKKKNAEAK